MISESANPYGHVKKFNRLSKDIRMAAHRVISKVALELYGESKIYGSAIDVNGNLYDFEIFSDMTYRVIDVKKYKDNIKEVAHETNPNTNSRNTMESSNDERSHRNIYNEPNKNGRTRIKNVKVFRGE